MMLSVGAWAQTSLQEQINSAEAGATITLDADVTISQTILIDKNITIDGGNHTIKSSVINKLGTFYINTGTCNFTIQNATIDGGSAASMAVVAYRGKANSGLTTVDSGDRDNNNSGNVINMTSCTVKNFTGFPNSYAGAVYVFGKSSATLTNCTFSGNTTSLQSTDGASGADVWAGAAATVNISGGSYQEVFVNSDKSNTANITISNGAKVEELAVCVTENTDGTTNQPHITIDNATVTNLVTETGNDLPSSAVITTNGGSVINMPGSYVAQIGDKKYESLADAITAVPTDGTETTIKMLADVNLGTAYTTLPATKNIVLDLNGKTITSANTSNGTFKVSGKFTINGEGTIQSTKKYAIQTAAATADVVLNGATLKTTTNSNGAVYGSYGIFTMNSGTIDAEGDGLSCKVIDIKGGTINAKGNAVSGSTGFISGGTITSTGNYGIYANKSGELIITGGNISGTKSAIQIYTENVKVSGSAVLSSKIGFASNATGIILAGTSANYIPESADLEIYDGETLVGYFTSSTTGTSCSEMDGKTVKLSKDINAMINIIGYDMVLDLNNHSITSTDGAAIMVKAGSSATKVRNVTITGEGNVSCDNGGGCVAVYVDRYNKLTIEGGNYVVGGDADNATIYIYRSYYTAPTLVNITGGYFESGDGKWILNCNDDAKTKGASIVVTGGEFKNFDPANSTVDGNSTGDGTNYVPEGYITDFTESGSDKIYTIMVGEWIAKINNPAIKKFRFPSLDRAIETANTVSTGITITLLKEATANVEPAANVTIDADGKALTLPTFTVADGAELSYAQVINATDDTYKVTTATYNRTGAVGTQWGTACLPFSFESAPEGYTLYTPTTVGDNVLNVTEVTYPVAAGTPVIFHKNNTDEVTMISSNASVKIDATPLAQSGSLALVGTFSQQNIESGLESIYFINGDKFHQAKASLTVPAYRAYINYSASGAAPAVLQLVVDGEATAIADVAADLNGTQAIYDTNGRQLSAPQKGINIMKRADGKTVKLIVK